MHMAIYSVLGIVLILGFSFYFVLVLTCTSGWFGLQCQYKCHCTGGRCNSDGGCFDGATCERGWFGPGCQYRDLMQEAISPNWLIDGDSKTCAIPKLVSNTGVGISMKKYIDFTWLWIVVISPERVRLLDLTLTFNVDEPCDGQSSFIVDSTTIEYRCQAIVRNVSYLKFLGAGVVDICSLYVSGGRNVALKQKTNQTRSILPTVPENADSAVDGSTNPDTDVKPFCAYVLHPKPSWRLMLNASYIITTYVMYNRDQWPERMKKFVLTFFDENFQMIASYTDNSDSQSVYTVTSPTLSAVREIQMEVTNPDNRLTLCEFEAYGDIVCPSGQYGRDCELVCPCVDWFCNVATGACQNGCPYGKQYMGCIKECEKSRYGPDCRLKKCSDHCLGHKCNPFTGVCLSGLCLNNFAPPLCTDCMETWYGPQCQNKCHLNCLDQLCDSTNGLCSNGCKFTHVPPKCTECKDTWYGPQCLKRCNHMCLGQTCDTHTGLCSKGCAVVKLAPPYCQECEDSWYGPGCLKKCPADCLGHKCDNTTGLCSKGCAGNFLPPGCQECKDGWYGLNCRKRCNLNCLEQKCEISTGLCLKGCIGNFVPPHCQAQALNKQAICSGPECQGVSRCENNTGLCSMGCAGNLDPPQCQVCRHGYYGKDCRWKCSDGCLNTTCHNSTGFCDYGCDVGRQGYKCDQGCTPGFYGLHCSSLCQVNCHQCNARTGLCEKCKRGFQGTLCEPETKLHWLFLIVIFLIPTIVVLCAFIRKWKK